MTHTTFINIFNEQELIKKFIEEFNNIDVIVYGEAYGGKEQRMSNTYGKEPQFIVFEVNIGSAWLNVPNAEDVANKLGLEFVPYKKTSTDLESLNEERDAPSIVAMRRGCGTDKIREGVVIKPLEEYVDNRGNRVITKHKRNEFMETKTPREVDPTKLKVLEEAREIAEEWVTPMRAQHVLDKFQHDRVIENTGKFGNDMLVDVLREAEGEIVVNDIVKKAIVSAGCKIYKNIIKNGEIQ